MASKQGKVSATQNLEPEFRWIEDPAKRILRIHLPGFKKDDFKVQIDNSGNLIVKGQRLLGDGRTEHLNQVLAAPKNSNLEQVTGRFEGEYLSIIFPQIVVQEKEKEREMEVPPQKGKEEKEEKREEKPPPQKEEKEEPKSSSKKFEKDHSTPDEKPKLIKEEKEKKEEKIEERKEEFSRPQEAMPRSSRVGEEMGMKKREKASAWAKKVKAAIEGWSDYGILDDLKETICKNKEVIAVAITAFSIGFYASRKLK